jgi:formyltetrahydrofolate-dependent phosphoribosylglycinamide formyltransferase
MSGDRVRVGVLISGRGSNMEALIAAAKAPDYPARIALVLSNRIDAAGLQTAQAAGVPAFAIDHRPFKADREGHDRAMDAALREEGVELVALAGYMRILSPWFIKAWSGRMLNIHPSLLPLFPGLHPHAQALAAGHAVHGCTVHWVTDDLDDGPILGQAEVPVRPDDDEAALAARVLVEEHRLYPECLATAARALRLERTA